MKTPSAVALAALALLAPAAVFGDKCTDKEVQAFADAQAKYVRPACPSLYDSNGNLVVKDAKGITAATLKTLAPCKASKCLSALGKLHEDVSTCTGTTTLDPEQLVISLTFLCEDFAEGDVTVADAKQRFDWDFMNGGNGSGGSTKKPTKPPAATTTKPTTSPATTKPATTKPANTTTPKPSVASPLPTTPATTLPESSSELSPASTESTSTTLPTPTTRPPATTTPAPTVPRSSGTSAANAAGFVVAATVAFVSSLLA